MTKFTIHTDSESEQIALVHILGILARFVASPETFTVDIMELSSNVSHYVLCERESDTEVSWATNWNMIQCHVEEADACVVYSLRSGTHGFAVLPSVIAHAEALATFLVGAEDMSEMLGDEPSGLYEDAREAGFYLSLATTEALISQWKSRRQMF